MSTSIEAQQEMTATEEELRVAERDYDLLLATGDDADIAKAEAAIARLRSTCARLERQYAILKSKELAERQAADQRTKEEAEAELARCREKAAAAISSFMEEFGERVAALNALAHEQLEKPLRALDAARAHADRLHGRSRGFVPPKTVVVNSFVARPDWITEALRSHFGSQKPLIDYSSEMIVLGFIENFSRSAERDETRPAA
jgi:hypothetical protein